MNSNINMGPHGTYLSAYSIAVKHGFDGSEGQWLASLKGSPGKDGTPAEFRVDETTKAIQWRHVGTDKWLHFADMDSLLSPELNKMSQRIGSAIEEGETMLREYSNDLAQEFPSMQLRAQEEFRKAVQVHVEAVTTSEASARDHANRAERCAIEATSAIDGIGDEVAQGRAQLQASISDLTQEFDSKAQALYETMRQSGQAYVNNTSAQADRGAQATADARAQADRAKQYADEAKRVAQPVIYSGEFVGGAVMGGVTFIGSTVDFAEDTPALVTLVLPANSRPVEFIDPVFQTADGRTFALKGAPAEGVPGSVFTLLFSPEARALTCLACFPGVGR